jgi:hypothetical protein
MITDLTPQPNKKASSSKWKIVIFSGITLGVICSIGIAALLLLPDIFINKYLKEQVEKEFASTYPYYSITISDLRINLFNSHIDLESVVIRSKDSTFSCSISKPTAKGIGWWQLVWKGTSAKGALDGAIAETQSIDITVKKNLYAIRCGHLIISVRDSLIMIDSLQLHPLVADSQFFEQSEFRTTRNRLSFGQLAIHGFSVLEQLQGKSFRASLLRINDASIDMLVSMYKPVEPDTTSPASTNTIFASLKEKLRIDSISIENTRYNYAESNSPDSSPTEGYAIQCGGFHISLHDSSLSVSNLTINPLLDAIPYFADSKYRRTRLSILLSEVSINGLIFPELLEGNNFQARSAEINKAAIGIQVSMYKPSKNPVAKTLMPNEILASVQEKFHIDSMHVINSAITYEEFYGARSKPATIQFNDVNVVAKGIANTTPDGDTLDIKGNTNFMNGGVLSLALQVPLTSPKFSLRCSGSLSPMKLSKFNAFLETAERARLTSGISQSASFALQINDGKAKGNVRIEYKDFSLAFLDAKTKSSKGIFNIIKSFLANTFKLKGSNQKDSSGKLKLGTIRYTRKKDDTFMQIIWFSVRSGVADLIGFPQR